MLMCIFCTFNAVFANVSADKTVTIKSENISVKEALNMVQKSKPELISCTKMQL